MKINVQSGQTLADISVQVYGTVEAMPLIASTNRLSMSSELSVGQVLDCPERVFDQYLQNYVRNNNIIPATK